MNARTEAARTALTSAIEARDALLRATTTPARLVIAEQLVARRRGELDAALGELGRAEAAHATQLGSLDDARHRLARARADKEVIERHFARWRLARQRLAERRED